MLEIRDKLEKILFIYAILTEIFIKSYKNATTLGRYQLIPLEMQTAIPPLRVCAGTFLTIPPGDRHMGIRGSGITDISPNRTPTRTYKVWYIQTTGFYTAVKMN